ELACGYAHDERLCAVRPRHTPVSRVERGGRASERVERIAPDEAALPRLVVVVLEHEPDEHLDLGNARGELDRTPEVVRDTYTGNVRSRLGVLRDPQRRLRASKRVRHV